MTRRLRVAAGIAALVCGAIAACDAAPDRHGAPASTASASAVSTSTAPAPAAAAPAAALPAAALPAAALPAAALPAPGAIAAGVPVMPVAAIAPDSSRLPIVPIAGQPVLWGYVDGAGIAHFASSRIDSRYDPVLREDGDHRVRGKTQGTNGLLTWLEISPDVKALQPLLNEAARATGVDEELLKAVITVESNYNARAVSARGAVGLMQLTPATADRYGTAQERLTPAPQRMLDARTNVLTGARMLADLTRRYGGIDIALAAWNAGEGTVRKAGGRMPAIAETEAHVHLVLELYWALLQRGLPHHARGFELAACAAAVCGP